MSKTRSLIIEYFQIFAGIIFASIGLKAFLLPNGFLDGGVTGIAILLNDLMGWNVSILLLVLSVPFIAMGWFTVSKRIVIKSIVSIVGLAIFIQLENFNAITDDKLLIAIFGGIFMGLGIGLAIRNGTVLDGSEVLGIYVHRKFGFSIGAVILVFNVILFSIAALLISVEVAMYSILTYLVTARIVDIVIKGFENYVGIMVVADRSVDLERALLQEVGCGITVYQTDRGYGSSGIRSKGEIIHLIVNRIDIRKAYNVIESIDSTAFIVEFDVNHMKGGASRQLFNVAKL